MSREHHDDDCPGCQPVLVEASTGRRLPANDPRMSILLEVWTARTTREEREAFHRVCISNGRDLADLVIVDRLTKRLERGLPLMNQPIRP